MPTKCQPWLFTFYGIDGEFTEAIPSKKAYAIIDSKFVIDYNFGIIKKYVLVVRCNNNIVEMYDDTQGQIILYRKDSNYKDCLNWTI